MDDTSTDTPTGGGDAAAAGGSSGGVVSAAERLVQVRATTELLRGLHTVLWQLPPAELAGVAGDLAELAAIATNQTVFVVAEAERSGVVEASQAASTTGWVADNCWHLRRQAHAIAKAAQVTRRPELAAVTDRIVACDLDPATADAVVREYSKIVKDLKPDARDIVLEQFLDVAAVDGPAGAHRLREELIARYGNDGELDDEHATHARQISLSPGRKTGAGLWHYDLDLDNEGRALLEAAINQLAAPQPGPEGERDQRPVALRRGQALVEVCRRVTLTHTAADTTGSPATGTKSTIIVTIDWQDLQDRTGAGTAIGTRAGEVLLSPAIVRKMACDGHIIPAVLGTHGEVLDLGRAARLFSPAQLKALWLRDRHCTFPHCTSPATWADAHHLLHWADGGPTDHDHGTLLCPRHHTIVHRDDLGAQLINGTIVWDERPGSYREHLHTWLAQRRAGPPAA